MEKEKESMVVFQTGQPSPSERTNIHINGGPASGNSWRDQIISMLADGTLRDVSFDAVVFILGENANHVRIRDEDLVEFAKTFIGKPFLRNHHSWNIDSRDGTILDSYARGNEIVQRISLTTAKGQKSLAEKQIDRFSIGFDFEDALCSICGNRYNSRECFHHRGQEYDGVVCEVILVSPAGVETSAVNVPAVDGTRLLSALRRKEQFMEDSFMDEQDVGTTDQVDDSAELSEEAGASGGEQVDFASLSDRLVPVVLAALLSNADFINGIAGALHLVDIDSRIGALESQSEEARVATEKLSLAIATLSGEILPGGDDHVAQFGEPVSWSGYRGAPATSDEPPPDIRPSRKARMSKDERSEDRKPVTTRNKRERAGDRATSLWGDK